MRNARIHRMRPHSKYDALNCLRNLWTSVARNCAARVLASRCRCLRTLCIWAARIRAGRLNCLRSLCFYASRVRALRTTASALMHAKAAVADSALHFQCFGVDPAFQLPQFHVCIFSCHRKNPAPVGRRRLDSHLSTARACIRSSAAVESILYTSTATG